MLLYEIRYGSYSEYLGYLIDTPVHFPVQLIVQEQSSFFVDGVYPLGHHCFTLQVQVILHDEIDSAGNRFYQASCRFAVRYFRNRRLIPEYGTDPTIGEVDVFYVREHRKHIKSLSDIPLHPVSDLEIIYISLLFVLQGAQGPGDLPDIFFRVVFLGQEIDFRMELDSEDVTVFRPPSNDSGSCIVFYERNDSEISFGFQKIEAHVSAAGENAGKMAVGRIIR